MSDWITTFWLPDQPPRKSNSRKVVRIRGRTRVIKSAKARAWTARALAEMRSIGNLQLGSADRPLRIVFEVFYETRRPDLSVELVLDAIEKAGVISNDRHVYEYTAHKFFSRERPGVLVSIGYLEDNRETAPNPIQ